MKTSDMTVSERFQAVMDFKPFDRLPIMEWACWWDKTLARWQTEGLPAHFSTHWKDRYEICKYFDLDLCYQGWYRSVHWKCPKPDAEKAGHGAGIIADMDDYERVREHLFVIDDEWPINKAELSAWAEDQKKGKAAIWFTLDGFFWLPRTLFGDEEHLYAFYDHPELMHRINQDNADWMIRMIDEICKVAQPDFMTFAEDMSYKAGPMLSKAHFEEFMKPYYEKVVPHLKERGIRALVDSDGNIHEPAGWFAEAGIEGMLPMERQSGVDMARLRQENPKQIYIGGFDKMTMPEGESAMRVEFEKLLPVAKQGGYIISCDHQTPPGVSLENYRLYLKLFREYAELAAR